jgi:Golgi phosphoprotein 3 (GPP34)
VELPQTLHAQLYLLAYDRKRRQFRFDRWMLFGFALRAAMLTDLYMSGHLEDKGGKAWSATAAHPADPVLRAALMGATGRDWAQLISYKSRHASQIVRDQLETTGWLHRQQRRMLGIIPTSRLGLYDEDLVSSLADRVTEALRNAIDDRPADPRPLAVGLLAVQAQMPVISSFIENSWSREVLREMTFAAIEPILELRQVIQDYYTDMRIDNIQNAF